MKHSKHAGRPKVAAQLEAEAQERWGENPAWKESQRRTSSWKKSDWDAMKARQASLMGRIAAGMDKGVDSPEVQAAVKAYHEFIDQSFYTCPASTFLGLSELWGGDDRFRATWEEIRPGLCDFVCEAARVYVNALLLVEERQL